MGFQLILNCSVMKKIIYLILFQLAFLPLFAFAQKDVVQETNIFLERYKNSFGADSTQFADAVQMCALICLENGDIEQAKTLLDKSDNIFRLGGNGVFQGRDTVQEIFNLDLLSRIEYECDRDYYAVRYAKKSYGLKQQFFGYDSYVTLISALDLSKLLSERLKFSKSHKIHNEAYKTYVNILKKEFCSISESERYLYWRTANKYIERTIKIAHDNPRRSNRGGEKSLSSAAYNAMLLSKGILLNTTIYFEDFILNSGNAMAIDKLNQKKSLYSQGALQSQLDSLDYEILNLLSSAGIEFSIPHLDVTWKDVQGALNNNDVAIEFYRTGENDYGAIIIKRGWKSPKILRLTNDVNIGNHRFAKLDELLHQELLQVDALSKRDILWNLSKAVWSDELLQYFPPKGKGRVFFAADANLQIAPLESFLIFNRLSSNNQFVTMSDCYDLYRISSTRELCYIKKDIGFRKNAILYGGLEYNMSNKEMLAEHIDFQKKVEEERMANYIAQNRSSFIRKADNIIPLPGTKKEVERISAILKKTYETDISTQLGIHGTEESFKHLSGRAPGIIHVATHGFYVSNDEITPQSSFIGANILDTKSNVIQDDNSMLCSGLLMSGALSASIPQEVEDGILTSKEISSLDLRNTQIAVLSACDTALGEVTKDGISGLQRGFKQAGTKSLLMSLWKVDDEATCKLMTEFYSNWIAKKMMKHDALEAAKKVVRETNVWENPKYWAAFILLDGLD